jgi:tRNA(Ile)-lysidine synthase
VAATRRLNELISATLPRLHAPDGTVVVALSGGADSAALGYLLARTGRPFTALHIDHGLAASKMLAEAAADVASRLDVGFETVRVELGEEGSPEERARHARYEVFDRSELAVLTAHTRDDNVETMLINLIRGTGPAGLGGIPRFRPPRVHRPILDVTRDETREIATHAGLPFVDDPMNEDASLTRNRVRRAILPLMRELNPQIDSALARTAELLQRDHSYLEELAGEHSASVLPASVVTTLPEVLGGRLIRRALEANGIRPTSDRIGRVWSVASGTSDRQELADGRQVVRRGALLVIEETGR